MELTIIKKGGHEFERDQRGIYGNVCRGEREGRNMVI